MVMSPQVSWLFFKARAKCPYLIHTGRASNAEKQPTGPGPEGCVEKWVGGCVARRLRIDLDMRPPRALPAAHFERNDITMVCETVH